MSKPKAVRKVEKTDRRIARKAAKAAEHKPLRVGAALGGWADQPPVAVLCAGVVMASAVLNDRRLLRTGLRMGAAFAVTTLAKALVKSAVDRTRPATARRGRYKSGKGRHNEGPWNSFPSGHTGNAVTLASAIAREYPDLALSAVATAVLTGVAQLPREAHYASDVIAGAAIGAAAEAATSRLFA